jgi:hypothetical protein
MCVVGKMIGAPVSGEWYGVTRSDRGVCVGGDGDGDGGGDLQLLVKTHGCFDMSSPQLEPSGRVHAQQAKERGKP